MDSRLPYCGGTDAASIMARIRGYPYFGKTGFTVWAERHAPLAVPPRDPLSARDLRFGTALEPFILAEYAETIAPLRLGGPATIYGPKGYEWMRGSLDSTVIDPSSGMVGIVDAKKARQSHHWIDYDDDRAEIFPEGYGVQVVWYLILAQAKAAREGRPAPQWADLAAFDPQSLALHVRRIQPTEAEVSEIFWTVAEWWEKHIIGGEMPPDDTSEACARWRLYCQPRAKSSRVATAEELANVERWRQAKARVKWAEADEEAAKLTLLPSMDVERLTVGPEKSAAYWQIQDGPHGSRVLRDYRFDEIPKPEAPESGQE